MQEQHFIGKVAVKALIRRSNEDVLISRDPADIDLWELPGGRLNVGESPEEALRRELREELGAEIFIVGGLVHSEQYFQSRSGEHSLLLAFEVWIVPGTLTLSSEVAEVTWVTPATFTDVKMYANCKRAVEALFKKK